MSHRDEKDAAAAQPQPQASPDAEHLTNRGIDRGRVIGDWVVWGSRWSWRALLIIALLSVLLWLLSKVSMAVVPLMFALLLTSALWKPVGWLERHKVPRGIASILSILLTVLVLGGIVAAIAPTVATQSQDLADKTVQGVARLQHWAAGPPLNIKDAQIDQAVDQGMKKLQEKSGQIAGGVFTGLSTVGALLVNLILVVMLSIFMLKDGPRFLPAVRRIVGREAGRHITECGTRIWQTLSGYIKTQAIVSAIDAVFIGGALLLTGTPLWPVLAILTFLGGFIPMVGAVVAGALAVLVALVGKSAVTALIILAVVIVVQQLEGNVLTPLLQGKTMELHAIVVLISVVVGGSLFGIPGAFFAVPVAAAVVVVLRYCNEQIDLATGDVDPDAVQPVTVQGDRILREVELRRAREVVAGELVAGAEPAPPARRPGLCRRLWTALRH